MHEQEVVPTQPTRKNFLSPDFTREEAQTAFDEVAERDLRPYDDEFLIKRLTSPDRLLRKNPDLVAELSDTLAATDNKSLLAVAQNVSDTRLEQAPTNEKPINSFVSYFTLLRNIDAITPASDDARSRANAIAALVAKRLVNDLPEDKLQDAYLTCAFLKVRLDEPLNQRRLSYVYTAKLEQLRSFIHAKQMAVNYIEDLPETESEPVSDDQVAHDSETVSRLFAEVRSTQQYGVKLGYTTDGKTGSLIFSDPPDLLNEVPVAKQAYVHQLVRHDSAAAQIVHSSKKNPQRIKPKYTQEMEYARIAYGDLAPKAVMFLGKDGELYADAQCLTPYLPLAQEKQRYTAYRDLQATLIAHYYDLTHAVETPRSAVPRPTDLIEYTADAPRDPLDSIERLVMPRLKGKATEQQPEDEPTESTKTGRTVRFHNVTWFIRHQPEGWHTSPAAYELAAKLGVRLGEGETLVKAHTRGSKALGEVAGHHLVKVSSSSPTPSE